MYNIWYSLQKQGKQKLMSDLCKYFIKSFDCAPEEMSNYVNIISGRRSSEIWVFVLLWCCFLLNGFSHLTNLDQKFYIYGSIFKRAKLTESNAINKSPIIRYSQLSNVIYSRCSLYYRYKMRWTFFNSFFKSYRIKMSPICE